MISPLLALLSTLAGTAFAGPRTDANLETELDIVDTAAANLAEFASDLEQSARPGVYLTKEEAVSRFQEYLFLHLMGQDAPAAEGFFTLVTTGALATAGLHQDAEWYLAEALAELGNFKTAAARFQAVVEDESHPFHDEAVRRLLELYASAGNDQAFRTLYETKIAPGIVRPTPLITYSLAKSFFYRQELGEAREHFLRVPPESDFYGRSRYFLGTIETSLENFEQARTHFAEARDLSVETKEDRQVHDLALLALGRIAYHLRDFDSAFDAYGSISADSQYADRQLYELTWTSIRRERWKDALDEAQIFLLKYPDHELAPRVRLLEGQLSFKESKWDDALASYEQVVSTYGAIRDQFDHLARSGADADQEISDFLASGDPDLPQFAVAMMRADPDLDQALNVYADLEIQRADIEASELLVAELQAFLGGAGVRTSYTRNSLSAHRGRLAAAGHLLTLLDIQERWLATLDGGELASRLAPLQQQRTQLLDRWKDLDQRLEATSGTLEQFERELGIQRAEIDHSRSESTKVDRELRDLRSHQADEPDPSHLADLTARIAALEEEKKGYEAKATEANQRILAMVPPEAMSQLPAAEIQSLGTALVTLSIGYAGLRPDGQPSAIPARVDADRQSLMDSFERLSKAVDGLERLTDSEIDAVRARFAVEVAAVAREREDYEATAGAARSVSLQLTRNGFGRLEDFFAEAVLGADMGIVDVYWSRQMKIEDDLKALKTEKVEVAADLERRFNLIRERMGDKP